MKIKNYVTVIITACFFLLFFVWNLFGEKQDYSESERRVLAKFPDLSVETVLNGKFAQSFEEYAVDRFPMRDKWRTIKAYARTYGFGQLDNHKIYEAGGHISKMEYPMNVEMADYAISLFSKIKDAYLENNNIYLAVIPDKNCFLAKENGYLSIDYKAFSDYMKDGMEFATYIEIADLLEADDYYYTDTHWRQEKITDVAEWITESMGAKIDSDYIINELEIPFYGVYAGQSALFHKPDVIRYLTNDTINPFVVEGYSEVVMVDLRYISSDLLAEYVEFEGADVLFLYSTLLLNNSLGMK